MTIIALTNPYLELQAIAYLMSFLPRLTEYREVSIKDFPEEVW